MVEHLFRIFKTCLPTPKARTSESSVVRVLLSLKTGNYMIEGESGLPHAILSPTCGPCICIHKLMDTVERKYLKCLWS